jgi:endonuclease/exonuclease/phosphatase family metal-dependent hydrolase
MLKVASYNIQKAIGHDMRRRPERTLAVMAETGADLVVVQEADRRFGDRVSALPEALIARETDFEPADLRIRPGSIGWHGNAVLVRKGTKVLKTKRLDLPYLEPRGAVCVVVELGQGPLIVVGAHLALTARWRQRQAESLAEFAARADMPLLLAGDLNEWGRPGKGLAPLARALTEHAPGATFPAFRPVAALDRLYHCGQLEVEGRVHDTPLARKASDHLPLVAELRRAG